MGALFPRYSTLRLHEYEGRLLRNLTLLTLNSIRRTTPGDNVALTYGEMITSFRYFANRPTYLILHILVRYAFPLFGPHGMNNFDIAHQDAHAHIWPHEGLYV